MVIDRESIAWLSTGNQLHGYQQGISCMVINRESIAWLSTGNQLHGYQQGLIGLKQNVAQSARAESTNKGVN